MMNFRPAVDDDWEAIERLLRACDLPVAGARAHLGAFVVAAEGDAMTGCVGAEVYGDAALLRSLAVRGDRRGRGIADQLVARLIAALKRRGVRRVALLTATAERFFARRGFVRVAWEDVPDGVRASEEFRGACPASAIAMVTSL
ncbi:MAG: arsenic resistance N-acetyltransferase ArsN2 [Alphaproteobacteria bacterium]|jgi:amino-acid N-acetyltransferase|nr:arsenic resistance N-acetyltransferase ArsN2 [Alphaproteobacteria bacterium]